MDTLCLHIGCAGWSIRKEHAAEFAGNGTHLQRYAQRLTAVEINSSFYRPHRPATYARWAASVTSGFRFSVKMPREITHIRRLVDIADPLDRFLAEAAGLGDALGPLLVQLPPSLAFDPAVAQAFFELLRDEFAGDLVCEPRHRSWFDSAAERLFVHVRVARVAADPASVPQASEPGGWDGLAYYRLHGSPRIYYSRYPAAYLDSLAAKIATRKTRAPVWCIFDNTALGAATENALELIQKTMASGAQLS